MTVTVNRPAPAARRLWPVVLRAAGLVALLAAIGVAVDRGTPEENAVDIGAGMLRIAVLGVVVAAGAAFDGRRRGMRWAAQVWTAVVAVLAVASVVRIFTGGAAGADEAAGVAIGLLVVLGLPLVALAVAGSAVGSLLQGRAAEDPDRNRPPTA